MYATPKLIRYGRALRVTRGGSNRSGEQQTAFA